MIVHQVKHIYIYISPTVLYTFYYLTMKYTNTKYFVYIYLFVLHIYNLTWAKSKQFFFFKKLCFLYRKIHFEYLCVFDFSMNSKNQYQHGINDFFLFKYECVTHSMCPKHIFCQWVHALILACVCGFLNLIENHLCVFGFQRKPKSNINLGVWYHKIFLSNWCECTIHKMLPKLMFWQWLHG